MGRGFFRVSAIVLVVLALTGGCAYLYTTLERTEGKLAGAHQVIADEREKGRESAQTIAALDADLTRVNAEAAALQVQLAAANGTIEKQTGDVAAFQKCLDGVTRAVLSASTRNTAEADAILMAAKADCDRAYATG